MASIQAQVAESVCELAPSGPAELQFAKRLLLTDLNQFCALYDVSYFSGQSWCRICGLSRPPFALPNT
jgi:hypothetical protein